MNKDKCRKQLLKKRKSQPLAYYQQQSDALVLALQQFVASFMPTAVHSFLPILKQREPNIWPFLQRLWEEEIPLYTSKIKGNNLQHVRLYAQTPLRVGAWSVPTPEQTEAISITALHQIDRLLVLVPLLAYDQKGYRIGYGKGYYDKFLRTIPKGYSLGLSFDPPIDTIEPETHDISLKACLTPSKTYTFNK